MVFINDILTSRNNPKVKWAASLSNKKTRGENRAFIAEGEKLVMEALDACLDITHIFISEKKKTEYLELIKSKSECKAFENTEVVVVTESVFEKISTEKSPEGIICVVKYLDFLNNADIIYKEEFFSTQDERALILCSVRDPGNLGAVIRSATAFGVDHIILSSDSADVYNHKTIRSSMGSVFRTRVTTVPDLSAVISCARSHGRRVYSAELTENAVSLLDVPLCKSDVFIIGNEGHGIPEEISSLCDNSVYIPISKKTESLNAAVAAAMFMWEQSKLK